MQSLVAPCGEAWVETLEAAAPAPGSNVAPARARGLKRQRPPQSLLRPSVAPAGGAWVEATERFPTSSSGAWVEKPVIMGDGNSVLFLMEHGVQSEVVFGDANRALDMHEGDVGAPELRGASALEVCGQKVTAVGLLGPFGEILLARRTSIERRLSPFLLRIVLSP